MQRCAQAAFSSYGQMPYETVRLSLVNLPSCPFCPLHNSIDWLLAKTSHGELLVKVVLRGPKLLVDSCPIGKEMTIDTKT